MAPIPPRRQDPSGRRPLKIHSPKAAIEAGIVYLTEDRKSLGLFLDMSVHDNINTMVFSEDAKMAGIVDFASTSARARSAIESLSIRVRNARALVGSLSGGNQQKVLLSRLLQPKPRVVILDEPTRGVDIGRSRKSTGSWTSSPAAEWGSSSFPRNCRRSSESPTASRHAQRPDRRRARPGGGGSADAGSGNAARDLGRYAHAGEMGA